jgi:hypothetical protein
MTVRLGGLTPGRFLYAIYHAPIGRVRASIAAGGPWEEWRTARGRQAMRVAARELNTPPCGVPHLPALEVHLLTGRNFWEQTVFCLWTFARHSGRRVEPVIYDDGTLSDAHRPIFARLFPKVRFVPMAATLDKLDAHLPELRFPTLRERWRHYPNIRKLIDPHLGSTGWKLVLDSDLLFFREPAFLTAWINHPVAPLHAVDCLTSYGYSRELLESLAGAPLAERVNVGLCGLRSEELDWEKLEFWCRTLIAREGTHYYLEQALVAMLVAGQPCAVASASEYVTFPRTPEVDDCRAVMHHYVADSKREYFRRNWRRCLNPGL